MQIVFYMPDSWEDWLKSGDCGAVCNLYDLAKMVKNGIVLPKNHGDLIDKDVLYSGPHFLLGGKTTVGDKDFGFHQFDMFVREDIDKVPVVIMADKEDADEDTD